MVMKMDNSRRAFDRSREPGLKKPRLSEEVERVPNFTTRPSLQRPVSQQRFRARDGDSANSDLDEGGYQPQPLPHQELVSQYKTALAELSFNSKPIITNLTIIAGENLIAAKAIADAVCFNILEVPSEQKLPSLYLLDSIVKNIGRDYIKYFAARLPEVFCKAYEQVDSPIRSSMRHLFGTWKGVFPPQTLQIIQKELAFNSTIGSSSDSISSRPDSQAQRPPHSIHVNPRYLERQRLQQSKVKEGTNDINAVTKNLTKDLQRPDRATDTAVGRPWDSHHSLRTPPSGIAQEKNSNSSYEEYEKGKFSRNSALEKRIADGREKPWSGAGSTVEESRSGQRNGFVNKPEFSNYPVTMPKSTSSGTRKSTIKSFVDRNSNGLSSSWKNSEEEEYSWSDMNSRLTDHGSSTAHNLRKDQLTPDNSEKLGYENCVPKLPGRTDVAARVDRESSSDSLSSEHREVGTSGQQPPLVWQIKEARSFGDPIHSGPPGLSSGFRESSIPVRTSDARSSGQVSGRSQTGKSISGPSAFGPTDEVGQRMSSLSSRLPLRQSSISQHHFSHQLSNLTEDEPQQIQSYQLDLKPSSYSGISNIGKSNKYSQDSVHVQLPKYLQPRDPRALTPSGPTSQSKRPFLVSQPLESESQSSHSQKPLRPPLHNLRNPTNHGTSLSGNVSTENSEESSTRDLLAAVMKSGILSNSSVNIINLPNINLNEIEKKTPELSIQPSAESGSPPAEPRSKVAKIAGTSSLGPPSSESSAVFSKVSPSTAGQPSPLATIAKGVSTETENVSSKSSTSFSNLLNSLVAKGLISASKEDVPNNNVSKTSSQPEVQSSGDTSTSSLRVLLVPVSSASPPSSAGNDIASSEADVKSGITLPQSSVEINSVIGYEFRPDTVRKFNSSVISRLFDNIQYQCSICGMRLKYQEQHDAHLQWHASKKQEANDLNQTSRRWFVNPVDWSARRVGCILKHEPACSTDECGKMDENEPMVPADETQCLCVLCGELFEDIYSLEKDEWMFKGAVYMSILMGGGEQGRNNQSTAKGPIVHANCVTESSAQDLGLTSDFKTEMTA